MKTIFAILLILSLPCVTYNQQIENSFIDALIHNKSSLADFIDKNELRRSERLGISYTDVQNKWLISFDVPEDFKAGFRENKYSYTLQTVQLEDGFSVVTLAVGSINYLQKFYFLNGQFVPPSAYFSRYWSNNESKYFKFKISEPRYFNDYCIKRLDLFVDSICVLLDVEPERKKLLQDEKIDYTFCRDEDEVEKITGYKSKGMSVLAFDEVITAYQTHFHEVAHILINFKLQNLGLYTLPFFMEGFAVAVGGRGGMAPRVVTDLGYYLQKTGMLTYDSILTYDSFFRQDANMTYAVSGLYNSFLLSELGSIEYLKLYRNGNGNMQFVNALNPSVTELPSRERFNEFLRNYEDKRPMYVDERDTISPAVSTQGSGGSIREKGDYYKIFIQNLFFIGPKVTDKGLRTYSKLIPIILSNPQDNGEVISKYCIQADSSSVKVYDLYNDELIYSFIKSFTLAQLSIPVYAGNGGQYTFFLRKNIFRNDFDNGYLIEGCCR